MLLTRTLFNSFGTFVDGYSPLIKVCVLLNSQVFLKFSEGEKLSKDKEKARGEYHLCVAGVFSLSFGQIFLSLVIL